MGKKYLLLLALSSIYVFSFAQKLDYNTQNGYVAKGYDVVEYFNNNAVAGEQQYTVTYNSVKYKFSSERNSSKFKSNPIKYIPQYGGWCAYSMGTNGKKFSINPKTFEIRDGKLYLFYSAFFYNALDRWKDEGPEKLILEADEYWNRINSN